MPETHGWMDRQTPGEDTHREMEMDRERQRDKEKDSAQRDKDTREMWGPETPELKAE